MASYDVTWSEEGTIKCRSIDCANDRNLEATSLPSSMCPYSCVDVSNVKVSGVCDNESVRVPCPLNITVEKQLRKSLLVSWSHPSTMLIPVLQYHVCINGAVRAVIPACYNTKALIENVNIDKSCKLTVRSVTESGQSPDAGCTLTVGKDSNVAPEDLRVSCITPVSAHISWYPGSSNCEHVILLNGLKVGNCAPGIYQISLKGLIPSTMYRCSIRVKDPKAVLEDKPVENFIDFKTLSKSLPDAPVNVQCEPGPQDGTLLVTWQPVMNQPKPPSRAAVAGYLVYADGQKVSEVDSPTGDHVLLKWSDLSNDPPLFITVKAKTREGILSADSNAVRVPKLDRRPFIYSSIPQLQNKALNLPTENYLNTTSSSVTLPCITNSLLPNYSDINEPKYASPGGAFSSNDPISQKRTFNQWNQLSGGAYSYGTTASLQSAPSYYVFHPQLKQIETSKTSTKPSLLEMETSYLIRQQQKTKEKLEKRSISLDDRSEEYLSRLQPTISHLNMTRTHVSDDNMYTSLRSDDRVMHGYPYQSAYPTKSIRRNHRAVSEPDLRIDSRFVGDLQRSRVKNTRCLVALFDYYPKHMSPNRNAVRDELSFKKGQLIKVLEEKDSDGFYLGKCNGRIGLVPSNLIMEISNDPRTLPPVPTDEGRYAYTLGSSRRHSRPWSQTSSRTGKMPIENHYMTQQHPHRSKHQLWAPNSDPSMSKKFDYDTSSGTPEDKLTVGVARARRMQFKQKSFSLEEPLEPMGSAFDTHEEGETGNVEWEELHGHKPKRYEIYSVPQQNTYSSARQSAANSMPGARSLSSEHHQATHSRRHRAVNDFVNPSSLDMMEPSSSRSMDYEIINKKSEYPKHSSRKSIEAKTPSRMTQEESSRYAKVNSLEQASHDSYEDRISQYNAPRKHGAGSLDSEYGLKKEATVRDAMEQIIQVAMRNDRVRTAIADFDYDPKVLSPNVDAEKEELSFLAGDLIKIYGDMDEDGFFVGQLDGHCGLVPSNFISFGEPASSAAEEKRRLHATKKEGVSFAPVVSAENSTIEDQTIETRHGGEKAEHSGSNITGTGNTIKMKNQVSTERPTADTGTAVRSKQLTNEPRKTGDPRKTGQQNAKRTNSNTAPSKGSSGASRQPDKKAPVKRETSQGLGKVWRKIVE